MRKKPILGLAGLMAVLALLAVGTVGMLSAAGDGRSDGSQMKAEVSITNLTRGQIMSPVFMARHDHNAGSLYALGQPASDALAAMAEDAYANGLLEAWDPKANNNVAEVMVATLGDAKVIPPGKTVTANFDVNDNKQYLSLVSMLVSTNDAFIGANGIDLSKSRTIYLTAYDSGSEANTENCDYIPGPPCGNHVEDPAESEGFVHVHAGIHGGGGLTPAMHDWRNPVARLTIETWKLSR